MQRRRHRPDDVVADEHRQRENRKPEHERIDRAAGSSVARGGELVAVSLRGLGGLTRGVRGGSKFVNRGVEVVHLSLRRFRARKGLSARVYWEVKAGWT